VTRIISRHEECYSIGFCSSAWRWIMVICIADHIFLSICCGVRGPCLKTVCVNNQIHKPMGRKVTSYLKMWHTKNELTHDILFMFFLPLCWVIFKIYFNSVCKVPSDLWSYESNSMLGVTALWHSVERMIHILVYWSFLLYCICNDEERWW